MLKSLLVPLFLLFAVSGCDLVQKQDKTAPESSPPPAATVRRPLPPITGLPDFSRLVEQEGPAVVNISIRQKRARGAPMLRGLPEDDPLFEFFRRFMPPEQTPRDEAVQSLGSGFIISADGIVLTNAHVVDQADEVSVRLTDKREFKARVLGVDKRTDVAVLKIPGKDLPVVSLGDSASVKQGEWVVAIGSPFGFDNSVTAGIVSAKGRSLPDESYVPFIQTDVAINPGNSGGPLFNMSGQVVGINSQIYSRTGGYMGLSFAIPIDVALQVAEQLKKHGTVHRGRLGVQIQELTPQLAQSFGLESSRGALVSIVDSDGPAARAGIQPGDVIIAFNDKPVESSRELPLLVGNSAPGSVATVTLMRKGEKRQIRVKLEEMPGESEAAAKEEAPVKESRLGLHLQELSPADRQILGLNQGVGIAEVEGAAARAGVEAGDVLLAINEKPLRTVREATALLAQARGTVALLIRREEQTLFIPVTVDR